MNKKKELGANAKELGAKELGAKELGAKELGAKELGAKAEVKYPKVKPIIQKETYLDNYYSKDFIKHYFI